MTSRKRYEMTPEDLQELYKACEPAPYMVFGGQAPEDPQARANRAWKVLGDKLGFDHMSVNPSSGGDRFFTAVPLESLTEEQADSEKGCV